MRGTLAAFSAAAMLSLGLSSGMLGCSSKSNVNQNPHPTDEAHGTQGWSLSLQSKCAGVESAEACVAGYGFTILTDGHYQLGPGPQGELRSGTLTADEFKSLNTLLGTTLTGYQTASMGHQPIEGTENEDTVGYSQGGNQPQILMKASGTEFTFHSRSGEDAMALYNMLRTLATKYYTLPFPDLCIDGAATLQTMYSSMQSCVTDTDCTYLENFEPLDNNSSQFVTTDDCSVIKPLAVGNASTVRANKVKLSEFWEQLRNYCGERLARADCTDINGFQLNGPATAPVCRKNVCQVGPH